MIEEKSKYCFQTTKQCYLIHNVSGPRAILIISVLWLFQSNVSGPRIILIIQFLVQG